MSDMTVNEWPKLPCRWTHDDDNGIWNTACGEAHLFEDGGPAENEHRFCPYCGGELVHGAPGVGEVPRG